MKRPSSDTEYSDMNIVERKSANCRKIHQNITSNDVTKTIIPPSLYDRNFLCDRTVTFMDSGDVCDIIAVELAERSLYFERLLLYQEDKSLIPLPEFLKSSFADIVEFIRTGKSNITRDNAYDLFISADYLLISSLKKQCSLYLTHLANEADIAISLWINCRHLYWPELGNMAFEKILEKFDDVRHCREFADLGILEVVQILSNDSLNSKNEMIVFEAICFWINSYYSQRVNYLEKLLPLIRFGLLTEAEMSHIRDTPIVAKQTKCLVLVSEALLVLNGSLSSSLTQQQLTPRITHDAIFVFGGWCDSQGPRAAVQIFDPRANHWTLWSAEEIGSTQKSQVTRTSLTAPSSFDPKGDYSCAIGEIPKRVYAGCVIVNSKIYLVGGFDGNQALKTTLCYDTDKDSGWLEVSCMYEKRHYVCVTVCQEFIYAIGGHNGEPHGRLSTAERYNISDNLWQPICAMTRVRSDASSAEVDGRVYVCGGFDGRLYHDTVEIYDSFVDQWCLLQSRMVSPRGGLSLARIDKNLYAIGGNDGKSRLNSVERFDIASDCWELVGTMSKHKSNLSCAVINTDIFILGGWSDEPDSGILDVVEKFDTLTKRCDRVKNLSFMASATCACTVSGKSRVNKYFQRRSFQNPRATHVQNNVNNKQNLLNYNNCFSNNINNNLALKSVESCNNNNIII